MGAARSAGGIEAVSTAFRDECAQLDTILRTLAVTDLDRPTPCPPWAVRDLVAHVRTGAGRLVDMLAAPAPPRAEVDAAGYFGAAKFTPQVDAARIDSARRAARDLPELAGPGEAPRLPGPPTGPDMADDARLPADVAVYRMSLTSVDLPEPETPLTTAAAFTAAWRATDAAVAVQPADRVVRTRHGDPMSLPEFLVTRVVEVGVHGLDLAVALNREPWLTPTAAQVIADLLTGGRPVPAGLGWDRLTLIRKATGRAPLAGRERAVVAAAVRWLSFGG